MNSERQKVNICKQFLKCVIITVKVQSAGAVLIDLLNDAIEILLGEFVVNLTQNLLESVCKTC